MSTCTDCNDTRSVPAGGGEPEDSVDDGMVRCQTCAPRTMLVLPAGGEPSLVDLPAEQTLAGALIRDTVKGWLEAVYLRDAVLYLNEEGKMAGLPANLAATRLLATTRGFDAARVSRCSIEQLLLLLGDLVVGDAVVVGNDGSPDTVGLNPETLTALQAAIGVMPMTTAAIGTRCFALLDLADVDEIIPAFAHPDYRET